MNAVTLTLYHECTQLVQKIFWLNWMKVIWWSRQTACIHGTELVWPRSFMVLSWCDCVDSWYGVTVMRFGMLLVWFCKVTPCIKVYSVHTAKEGPVRIQYKCLVRIYVFPEMKLLFQKQYYNVLSLSSFTHISVRDLYISRIGLPILQQGNMWTAQFPEKEYINAILLAVHCTFGGFLT